MEETHGNMAPPGAYESHESRQAQPTTSAAEAFASADATSAGGDVEMTDASTNDDAGQHEPPARAVDTAMDEEEKHGEVQETQDGGGGDDDATTVLHLKFLHRDRVTLRCAPTIAIADLKQLVRDAYIQAIQQDQADSQASQQDEPNPATQPLRLIYKGKVLKDDQTLDAYNFLSEDTVHAVFSRPPAVNANTDAASGVNAPSATTQADTERATGASGDAGQPRSDTMFVFETDAGGGMPDISRLISSMVNSAMSASDNTETTATIRIYPVTTHGTNESTGSSETTTSNTTAPSSSSTTTQAQRGASVVPTPTVGTAPSPIIPNPNLPVPSPPVRSGSATLLNQAAALRRSIPALELAPLSRLPELPEEMYNLGNAMRESGDTYLAIHRQLQFLATRFLQDHHLSVSERARLRSRVQQLITVMESVTQLSSGVSQQLASCPYGLPSSAAPSSVSDAVSGAQTAAPPTVHTPGQPSSARTQPPPLAQAVQSIFTEILGAAGANPAQANPNPGDQALNGLPSFLNNLFALASPPPTTSSAPQQPTVNGAQASQTKPFLSFAPKLAEFVTANPNLLSAGLDNFLRGALPLIDRHIVTCYSAGSDEFVRNGVAEVENALRLYEEAHQRIYTTQESRRSIVRLAMQELAQIVLPMAPSLQARATEIQSWIRRSCSHLFAELCEIAPAATAAQMTGLVAMQLLSGNDQSFVRERSPFLDCIAIETESLVRRRFQFS